MQKFNGVVVWGISVDTNFLKAQAERCRLLAESADEFTKRRLLDLAAHYDRRIRAAATSVTTAFSKSRSIPKAKRHKSERPGFVMVAH